jgi:hypothetical protein
MNCPALTLKEIRNLDKISELFPKVLGGLKPQYSIQLVLGSTLDSFSPPTEYYLHELSMELFILDLSEPTKRTLSSLTNFIMRGIQFLLVFYYDAYLPSIISIKFICKQL